MKKIIIVGQILIVVLILVKVASVLGILEKADYFGDVTSIATQALAQSKVSELPTPKTAGDTAAGKQAPSVTASKTLPVAKDAMEDILAQSRDLAAALAAKKIELDNRENVLRADEQRLIALRKEITEKITILKTQEEKLATALDTTREEDIKRFKEMAKVYENTPPAKAGPMMEKLDTKTAAGITMNMKKDKAGALWAYITPQKAVDITKEITRAGGYKSE
jgi:flagellar motility protein MotE (MotC chaperone)